MQENNSISDKYSNQEISANTIQNQTQDLSQEYSSRPSRRKLMLIISVIVGFLIMCCLAGIIVALVLKGNQSICGDCNPIIPTPSSTITSTPETTQSPTPTPKATEVKFSVEYEFVEPTDHVYKLYSEDNDLIKELTSFRKGQLTTGSSGDILLFRDTSDESIWIYDAQNPEGKKVFTAAATDSGLILMTEWSMQGNYFLAGSATAGISVYKYNLKDNKVIEFEQPNLDASKLPGMCPGAACDILSPFAWLQRDADKEQIFVIGSGGQTGITKFDAYEATTGFVLGTFAIPGATSTNDATASIVGINGTSVKYRYTFGGPMQFEEFTVTPR